MHSRKLLRFVLISCITSLFAYSAPALADSSHARVIRLSLVQGEVRFAREFHNDPLADQKAVWENAALNLPIRQGYALATDHGRAEVEFENGAMAFLSENTVLEFYDLSLEDGAKTTRLVLRQGTASFYVNPASGDYFSVTGGDFTVEANDRTNFRVDNFDDGSIVNVSKGHVSVLRSKKTTLLAKGQSFSMRAGDDKSVEVGREADADDFDRWVSGREDAVLTATSAAQQYVNGSSYSAGLADLYTYGSWYPVSGYGYCWRPYGAGLGWSPFDSGGWYSDPYWGLGFVGYQPWGWLPYHYGGWLFEPGFGWLWSPFGLGFGAGGFVPFRPVTGVFVRSGSGLLGIVPVHPLDAHGKTPVNLTQGVFPVTAGAVSAQRVAADTGANWKVLKSAPREALASNLGLTQSAAPTRVSRTLVAGTATSRVVTLDRNSSIAYDPVEHKFVNGNAPRTTEAATQKDSANLSNAAAHVAGAVTANRVATPPSARETAGLPARASSAPPHRSMTPPPAPRSAASFGGGSAAGSRASFGAAGASHGSVSGGASSGGGAHVSAAGGGGRAH